MLFEYKGESAKREKDGDLFWNLGIRTKVIDNIASHIIDIDSRIAYNSFATSDNYSNGED